MPNKIVKPPIHSNFWRLVTAKAVVKTPMAIVGRTQAMAVAATDVTLFTDPTRRDVIFD